MNRPTTRTEQMLDSASKGVSSRLMLPEAARFVDSGEIFLVRLIQTLLTLQHFLQLLWTESTHPSGFFLTRAPGGRPSPLGCK
jgi:hypothetical protein